MVGRERGFQKKFERQNVCVRVIETSLGTTTEHLTHRNGVACGMGVHSIMLERELASQFLNHVLNQNIMSFYRCMFAGFISMHYY